MSARPHPQARWTRGEHGIGHIDVHGDVSTTNVPEAQTFDHARWSAPHDAYAHFLITPGGHVDARMTGPMATTEFYRLLQQAHPDIAPKWTRTDSIPRWEPDLGAGHEGDSTLDNLRDSALSWRHDDGEHDDSHGLGPRGLGSGERQVRDSVRWLSSGDHVRPQDGRREGRLPSLPHGQHRLAAHPEVSWVAANHPDWSHAGFNANRHPVYEWADPAGNIHTVTGFIGQGGHNKAPIQRIGPKLRTLFGRCQGGTCSHVFTEPPVEAAPAGFVLPQSEHVPLPPGSPVLYQGQQHTTLGHPEPIEGVHYYDLLHPETGAREDTIPHREITPLGHFARRIAGIYHEPGQWARGLVTPQGEVHTWPEDEATHNSYICNVLGDLSAYGYDKFSINPDGRVHGISDPAHHELVERALKRPIVAGTEHWDDEDSVCGGTGNHPDGGSCDECEDRLEAQMNERRCPECYSPNTVDHVDEHAQLSNSECLNCGHDWYDQHGWDDHVNDQSDAVKQTPAYQQWAETHLPGYTGEEPPHSFEWEEHLHRFEPGQRLLLQEHDEGGPRGEPHEVVYRSPDPNYLGAHYVHDPTLSYSPWVMHNWLTPLDDLNDLPTTTPPQGHTGRWVQADGPYGFTNGDTSEVVLGIDNDSRLHDASRRLVEKGATPEQLAQWALKAYIGPYNKQQLADAQEWNEIPEDERPIDPMWQEGYDKHGEEWESIVGPPPERGDSAADLIDPEMVNWLEILQHIKDELDENDEWDRNEQKARELGLGWTGGWGGNENEKMRDALYRFHGAVPDEELGPGSKINDPRAYHNINVHVPYEHARAMGHWPEQFISLDTRNALWGVQFKKLIAPYMDQVREMTPGATPEEHEDMAYNLMRHNVPQSERDDGKYDESDPQVKNLIYSDPGVQHLIANGHQMRLHDLTDGVIGAIQNGRPHPYISQMQQALQQRGYSAQEIEQIMAQKWRWDEATRQMVRINPIDVDKTTYDPTPDQRGDTTFPQEWLARSQASIHEAPHAEELLHYLKGHQLGDDAIEVGGDPDPSYDDANPSTPDPVPGAYSASAG
jgi:Zn ribbon nucleic-acid-binding protein